MSTDTIGPDGPPLSTEGWEAGVREMSTDDLRAALRQARKDGAEMRTQRDWWKGVAERALESSERLTAELEQFRTYAYTRNLEALELSEKLAEANERAELNHQACLELMGQLEDLRCRTGAQLRIAADALGAIEGMHQ